MIGTDLTMDQTQIKGWCHGLRAVAIYANRQFCSNIMIGTYLTVVHYPSKVYIILHNNLTTDPTFLIIILNTGLLYFTFFTSN